MLLHISDLSIGFKQPLIADFHLELPAGAMCAITGRNGTGKTTLLKTIAGLLPPLAGSVRVIEKNIHHLSASERARLVSISLTQRIALQGIDVQTLVMMGRYPTQGRFTFTNDADEKLVADCLSRMQLSHLANKPLAQLSDGEMQKAMIAKALAQQTPLLLMDEPTAFLDYVAKEELLALLTSLCKEENMCIIFSSHDMQLVEQYAARRIEIPAPVQQAR